MKNYSELEIDLFRERKDQEKFLKEFGEFDYFEYKNKEEFCDGE